ncbi:ABC transporter permease [[Clostridium] hylemonae]|uniref:ABC transporter permease n=1 Tax=[Clostridium] hylemonae TaxID=89153 RepID=UPI0011070D4B|nr:ABC transporter permease subunit [[Clostridium] hylemonae]
MRGFAAFTRKEFTEYLRSYKLLIIVMVFLLLGFMNPVSAKYLPELMENFMPAGMKMEIPEPVIADAWAQFFKNVPQIGLVVMVIITSGTMSQELSRGTLLPVLTKGLKRRAVWLSKFTGAAVLWTGSYFLSFAVTYVYSLLFWDKASVPELGTAVFFAWLFGLLLQSVVLLGSTLSRSYAGGLLSAGALVLAGMVMSLFHGAGRYSPLRLASDNMSLIDGTLKTEDFLPAAAVTGLLTAAAVLAGIMVFDKKQL